MPGELIRLNPRGTTERDLVAVVQQLNEITRLLARGVGFGDPQDPTDPTSATRAGGDDGTWVAGDHNGTPANISGSWVEVPLESTGPSDITCTHNLYLDDPQYALPVTGEPNCRWIPFGVMHDGTGSDSSTRLKVSEAFVGGTVAVNEIDLRFNLEVSGTTPTIGSSNPVLVTLFFTRATRGE